MSLNFPSEILQLCFSHLPQESLHKCAQVCKQWNANSKLAQDLQFIAKMKEVLIATLDAQKELQETINRTRTFKINDFSDIESLINDPGIQKIMNINRLKSHIELFSPLDIPGFEDLLKKISRIGPEALSQLGIVHHVRVIKLLVPQESSYVHSIFRKSSKIAVHTLLKLADVTEVRKHVRVMSLVEVYKSLRPDCASLEEADKAFFNPSEDIDLKCQAFDEKRNIDALEFLSQL